MDPPENTPEQAHRDSRGRFLPGATGNRGGRPRVAADVREAIKRLLEENALSLHGWLARVAKTNPAKTVALYAGLADFVTPRLLRSEVTAAPSQFVVRDRHDPDQLARAYEAMIMHGASVSYEDAAPAEPPAAMPELRSAESQPEADPLAEFRPCTTPRARSVEGEWE